jgi:hypothetical protein
LQFFVGIGEREMSLILAEPKEWWFEIPPDLQAQCWQQSQAHRTESRCWNAYLNQICLSVVLDWLQTEEAPTATSWLTPAAASAVWEFVNGSAITIGDQRVVLIPTEVIEDDLEVPQEWVDIPSWAGDYYLGAEVGLDGGKVRVWGYATHQELKTLGSYDADDRAYFLDAQDVSTDLTTFAVIRQRCVDAQTRAAIAPLPELPLAQAENLIQRLSADAIAFHREAIPFQTWGALLENAQWRQRLYQSQGRPTRVGSWLQGQVEAVWQSLEAVLTPQQIASGWRSRSDTELVSDRRSSSFDVSLAKVLDFGDSTIRTSNGDLALVVGVTGVSDTEIRVGVKIYPAGGSSRLPNETQVRLLDESGVEIGQASAAITQSIQLQFRGRPGERFNVEVNCGDNTITELFEI